MAPRRRRPRRRAPGLGGDSKPLLLITVAILALALCGVAVVGKSMEWLATPAPTTTRPPRSTTTTRPLVPLPAGVQTAQAQFTLVGDNVVTAEDMVEFYRSKNKTVHPGTSSIEELTVWYVQAGAEFGIRGDLMFVQSVVETGWFSFPDGGQVRPDDHNFAGICAFDTVDRTGCRTPNDREGIRLQAALIREAATKGYRHRLPYKVHWKQTSGCCTTASSLAGKWATSPDYGRNLNLIYTDLLRSASYGAAPQPSE